MPRCSSTRSGKRRNGFSVHRLLIGLAVVAGGGGLVWYTFPNLSFSSQDTGPTLHVVTLGDFVHDITERGDLESASNVDIRCEVESRGSQGTMILELIDEGAYVEPGDVLCKLDSSSFEQELVQQQIVCNTSHAAVIQARNTYETAVISKEEYLNGTYEQQMQQLEGNLFVAEENLRQAEQAFANTQKLFARGYVTDLAVEANRFSMEDAKKEHEKAHTEKMVLEDYTKRKMLKQLDADIKTAEARLKSVEHSYELDLEKLADIKAQVEKCTVIAPTYGQVVYANVTDHHGTSEIIIEEGGSVRERQVIFRLPDPNRMQVKAKVNEASVSAVSAGMPVGIRLDAFPDLELKGEVEKVNEYPLPTSFFSGSVKEYETTIRIHLPDQGQFLPRGKKLESGADPGVGSESNAFGKATAVAAVGKPLDPPETPPAKETAQRSADKADTPGPSSEDRSEPDTASDETFEARLAKAGATDDTTKLTGAGEGLKTESREKVQLRPGMTAEVKIRVKTIPNVLQVPVQAIVEHGGKNYCLMYDKISGWANREVKIGATNDKTVVIRAGLKEGDKVVMGATKHREKVKWPKIEDSPSSPKLSSQHQGVGNL